MTEEEEAVVEGVVSSHHKNRRLQTEIIYTYRILDPGPNPTSAPTSSPTTVETEKPSIIPTTEPSYGLPSSNPSQVCVERGDDAPPARCI